MSHKLESLGWPEAKLFDLAFDGNVLSFKMLDLVSCESPLKHEVVEVVISHIRALKIEMIPYKNGKFIEKEIVIDIGGANDKDEDFEGTIGENMFTNTAAEYFWISADVNAENTEINRTGKYEYVSRLRSP